jgi:hypothetical protein
MKRIWLVAALLYGWGMPVFDGYRPGTLDRPLRDFQRTVNAGVTDARRALSSLDDLRAVPAMVASLRRFNSAF